MYWITAQYTDENGIHWLEYNYFIFTANAGTMCCEIAGAKQETPSIPVDISQVREYSQPFLDWLVEQKRL